MRILVIALSGIGDALLFTPAAKTMRDRFPDSTIDALVMFKGAQQLYERTGLFDQVIYHDFLNGKKFASLGLVLGLRGKYDASISVYPSNRKEYNLIQFLIGAAKRAGVRYLRRNLTELGFLNNCTITEDDSLHCVEENARLCEKAFGFEAGEIPDLQLPLTASDKKGADSFLKSRGVAEESVIVGLHPGSATFKNQIKRRWEPEKFATLARKLAETINARVLIFGGPDEGDLKKSIVDISAHENVIAVDVPGVPETAALIAKCNVFVSNDSALMHLASAMKRKIVAIIGPTNTHYIHPWHTEYEIASLNLDCSPCFIYSPRPLKCFRKDVKFKCIKELNVELVYDKTISLLRP